MGKNPKMVPVVDERGQVRRGDGVALWEVWGGDRDGVRGSVAELREVVGYAQQDWLSVSDYSTGKRRRW